MRQAGREISRISPGEEDGLGGRRFAEVEDDEAAVGVGLDDDHFSHQFTGFHVVEQTTESEDVHGLTGCFHGGQFNDGWGLDEPFEFEE